MNSKTIPTLRNILWLIGLSTIAFGVVRLSGDDARHFQPLFDETFQGHQKEPYLLTSARLLSASIAQGSFAFLMADVFEIIYKGASTRRQRAEVLLFLTCAGFCCEGLLGFVSWIYSASIILPQTDFSSVFGLVFAASYVLNIFSNLISLVYAAAIFILYRPFSKMAEFEDAVV